MAGAGTHLHELIKAHTGMEPSQTCSCRDWIIRMDKQGPEWCRSHLKMIVAHLYLQAQRMPAQWGAVSMKSVKGIANAARSLVLKGAFWVPGHKMVLERFIAGMVLRAILAAEEDLENGG